MSNTPLQIDNIPKEKKEMIEQERRGIIDFALSDRFLSKTIEKIGEETKSRFFLINYINGTVSDKQLAEEISSGIGYSRYFDIDNKLTEVIKTLPSDYIDVKIAVEQLNVIINHYERLAAINGHPSRKYKIYYMVGGKSLSRKNKGVSKRHSQKKSKKSKHHRHH
jgi:hypothetical protein